jgi:hypothetical protein
MFSLFFSFFSSLNEFLSSHKQVLQSKLDASTHFFHSQCHEDSETVLFKENFADFPGQLMIATQQAQQGGT